MHGNPNKNNIMNIFRINMAHFLDVSLFYFMVQSVIMLVMLDLVEIQLCYTHM